MNDIAKLSGGIFMFLLCIGIIITSLVMTTKAGIEGGFILIPGSKKGTGFLLTTNIINVLYFFILGSIVSYLISSGAYDDDEVYERSELSFWMWSIPNALIAVYMLLVYLRISPDGKIRGWGGWYIFEIILVFVFIIASIFMSALK